MSNNLFLSVQCPMTRAMAFIGTKWKPIIIYIIGHRTIRFGQLAAMMPLISRKVLTEQLKDLEGDGIIVREAFGEVPPRVEYRLSDKGLALLPIFKDLCNWNRTYEGGNIACAMNAG